MHRKIAAASGVANSVRSDFSATSPTIPTGMVPMMISQASRESAVSMRRARIEYTNPETMRTQSRR